MVTNEDGDILYYSYNSSWGTAGTKDGIRKWNNASTSDSSDRKPFYFTSKDFSFGDINVLKKLYKVYITYKTLDTKDSGIRILGSVNGLNTFNVDFSDSSTFAKGMSNSGGTAAYTSSTLNETDGKWLTAELKFDDSSEVNNIYTFQLQAYVVSLAATTGVQEDFQINDISIVYRAKTVK